MFDEDFKTQTDAKGQEKNELAKLIEGFDDFFNEYNKENRISTDRIVDKLSQLELKSIEAVNDEENIS